MSHHVGQGEKEGVAETWFKDKKSKTKRRLGQFGHIQSSPLTTHILEKDKLSFRSKVVRNFS